MKADPISFKRATSVSLVGLALQTVLALALLIYGVFGRDSAAITAFYAVTLGLPVWLALALVFHQHRLERVEAVEAELYASSSAAQASVFEGIEDELRVAAKRLAWMHRVLLPILSLLLGGALVGVGLWRFGVGRAQLTPGGFTRPELTGWAVSLGIGLAVVGFIFARFVAGMAKQTVWGNLRAGASAMVGASLLGLGLAVGHGVGFAGNDIVLRYLNVAFAALMILLGGEVFLNFVLNIYRPRRPGEIPRPAFDSRILGFIAAPDRLVESISDAINYQFGFDVTSTWFYRLLSRSILSLAALAAAVIWLLTTMAVVKPNEKGLLLHFGSLVREINAGLLWKWPWPFQAVETYPALELTQLTVGSATPNPDGPILWTNAHSNDEVFFLVQPTPAAGASRSEAAGLSLLSIEVAVQYTVDDLVAYRLLAADGEPPNDLDSVRRDLLRSVASRELMETAGSMTVDDILGDRRAQMGAELRTRIAARFAALGEKDPATGKPRGAGVRLLFVGVAGAHPPANDEVALKFENVVAAEQQSEAALENAEAQKIAVLAKVAGSVDLAQRIVVEIDKLEAMRAGGDERAIKEQQLAVERLLSDAGGDAAVEIQAARAERWDRHMNARGLATRQQGHVALYRAAPRVYIAKLYFDALRDALEKAQVYITAFPLPHVRFNFEEIQTNIGGFNLPSANKE